MPKPHIAAKFRTFQIFSHFRTLDSFLKPHLQFDIQLTLKGTTCRRRTNVPRILWFGRRELFLITLIRHRKPKDSTKTKMIPRRRTIKTHMTSENRILCEIATFCTCVYFAGLCTFLRKSSHDMRMKSHFCGGNTLWEFEDFSDASSREISSDNFIVLQFPILVNISISV